MNRGILYHSAIQTEIRDILDHYEGISIQLADDFWNELTKAFDYARRYPTSALSSFGFRIKRFQLCACISDFELPINPSLVLVLMARPSLGFGS